MKKDFTTESNFVLEFIHRNVSGFNLKEIIMTTVATEVQAVATVESLLNPIDQLSVLDRQQKGLAVQVKNLKDTIANTYGEGKHRGEKYGVRVTIENRKGSVDMEKLCAYFNITEADLDKFRGDSIAVIKVSATV
jgi:hypothetical protein